MEQDNGGLDAMSSQTLNVSIEEVQQSFRIIPIFHQLLSIHAIDKILSIKNTRYLDPIRLKELAQIYQNYIGLSLTNAGLLNASQGYKQVNEVFVENFEKVSRQAKQIGFKAQELESRSYRENNDALLVLNAVFTLKNIAIFNNADIFNTGQVKTIFKLFKEEACPRDIYSFAFLYLYLQQACKNSEKNGKKTKEIVQKLNITLNELQVMYPPAPAANELKMVKDSVLMFHQSQKLQFSQYEHKIPSISLVNVPLQQRYNAVLNLIEEQIAQANKYFGAFKELITGPCLKGTSNIEEDFTEDIEEQQKEKKGGQTKTGFGLKMGIKIRSMKDKKAVDRAIEKLFKKQLKKINEEEKKGNMNENYQGKTLDQFYSYQNQRYKHILQSLINKSTLIKFNISDMLRAKCLFDSVYDINHCATLIKQKLQKLSKRKSKDHIQYELIEVDNRLKSAIGTSDIVFKIRINSIVTQLQLVMKFNYIENEFCHKIYEILRTEFFQPINFVRIYNQIFSKPYLSRLEQIMKHNNKIHSRDEQIFRYNADSQKDEADFTKTIIKEGIGIKKEEILIFKDLQPLWEQYRTNFKLSLDLYSEQSRSFITIPASCKQFFITENNKKPKLRLTHNMIIRQNSPLWFKFNAEFYSFVYEHYLAIQNFKQYALELSNKIESQRKIDADYIDRFKEELQHTYSKIGKKFKEMNKISESMDYYHKCLRLQLSEISTDIPLFSIQKPLLNFDINVDNRNLVLSTATTLNNIGSLLQLSLKQKQALKYFEKCLEIKESFSDISPLGLISVLNNIGRIYSDEKQYEKSLEYYLKCQKIQRTVQKQNPNMIINIAPTLNNLGALYSNYLNNQSLAIKYYDESLKIVEAIKGQNSQEAAAILNDLGSVYDADGKYEQALVYFNKCLDIEKRLTGNSQIAVTLNNIASTYSNMNSFEEACKYYELSLDNLNSIENPTEQNLLQISTIYNNIGMLQDRSQDYEKSVISFQNSLKYLRELYKNEDSAHIADTYNNLGWVLYEMEKKEEALGIFNKSLEIYERVLNPDALELIPVLNNMAKMYDQTCEQRKALQIYQRCYRITKGKENEENAESAKFLQNIALVLYDLKEYPAALDKFSLIYKFQVNFSGQNNELTKKAQAKMNQVKKKISDIALRQLRKQKQKQREMKMKEEGEEGQKEKLKVKKKKKKQVVQKNQKEEKEEPEQKNQQIQADKNIKQSQKKTTKANLKQKIKNTNKEQKQKNSINSNKEPFQELDARPNTVQDFLTHSDINQDQRPQTIEKSLSNVSQNQITKIVQIEAGRKSQISLQSGSSKKTQYRTRSISNLNSVRKGSSSDKNRKKQEKQMDKMDSVKRVERKSEEKALEKSLTRIEIKVEYVDNPPKNAPICYDFRPTLNNLIAKTLPPQKVNKKCFFGLPNDKALQTIVLKLRAQAKSRF